MFEPVDSFIEFAQRRGLNPLLDPQSTELSTEGRAVPDYGAPLNFFPFVGRVSLWVLSSFGDKFEHGLGQLASAPTIRPSIRCSPPGRI